MNKKLTIYDIAKLSGFSPKTVSRVINGGENVKESTYVSVMRVVEQYGYTPNIYARNLSSKATTNILISIKKVESFPLIWFQTLLDKLLVRCKEAGVNAIVEYFGDNDKISDSILSASGSLVDGVVVFYENHDDVRIDFLKNNKIPFIVFGKSSDLVYVSNNDYQSLYHLIGELTEQGHEKLWMLMGNETAVSKERVRGATEAIKNQTLPAIDLSVFYDLTTIESVYEFVSTHLNFENKPDVIFVSGDEKVQGLIKACYEKGIQIPTDIAVVGFDNIPMSQYYTPALSTISPDYEELSRQLVERLLAIISGKSQTSIEVPTTFIKRQSS